MTFLSVATLAQAHSPRSSTSVSCATTKIKDYVKHCRTCQIIKSPPHAARAPLKPILINKAFKRILIDIAGPLTESRNKNKYILAVICKFTKWLICVPLSSLDSKSIARALMDYVICQHSVPESLCSDPGSNLKSEFMKTVCDDLGIK